MTKHKKQPELAIGKSSGKTKKIKTRLYTLVLLVGVGLIVTALVTKDKKGSDFVEVETSDVNTAESDNNPVNSAEDNSAAGNYIEGVLGVSEDTKLGNFKLASKFGDIYLRTSRDFSRFVGLQVLVLINGTPDKFELMDIQPVVQKDGYIMPQQL